MNASPAAIAQFSQSLNQLGLSHLLEPLLAYLRLLCKWNKAYNLTAIRDPDEMLFKHLLDSLAILPWVKGERCLDVGTGPGLPGIPLALATPDQQWTLLDSNIKKVNFLRQVKRELHLTQVNIIHQRVEQVEDEQGFDLITSRAFAALQEMISGTRHLIAPTGHWLAMKGRVPEAELKAIQQPFQVIQYSVDQVTGERCLVLIDHHNKE